MWIQKSLWLRFRDFSGIDIFIAESSGLPGEIKALEKTTPCQSYFQKSVLCGLCFFQPSFFRKQGTLPRSYVFLICFPNEEGTYFFKKQGVQINLINPVNSHQLHHALRMTEMWLSPLHKPRRYISCSRNRVNTFSGINNRTPTTEWGEENVCSIINNCKLPQWNLFFLTWIEFFFFSGEKISLLKAKCLSLDLTLEIVFYVYFNYSNIGEDIISILNFTYFSDRKIFFIHGIQRTSFFWDCLESPGTRIFSRNFHRFWSSQCKSATKSGASSNSEVGWFHETNTKVGLVNCVNIWHFILNPVNVSLVMKRHSCSVIVDFVSVKQILFALLYTFFFTSRPRANATPSSSTSHYHLVRRTFSMPCGPICQLIALLKHSPKCVQISLTMSNFIIRI